MRGLCSYILVAACAAAFTRLPGSQEDAIVITRPTDPPVDDAAWERIRKGYVTEKQRFSSHLVQLDRLRFDIALDSPESVLPRRKAIRTLFESHEGATIRELPPEKLLVLNSIQVLSDVSPRLSGRVLRVGEGQEFATFQAVLPQIKPGDTIHLGKGKFGFGGGIQAKRQDLIDVAIQGSGSDATTLHMSARELMGSTSWKRVSLENLKVDCSGDGFIDQRVGGSFLVRRCEIVRYRTAIFSLNSLLYIEDCTFDGSSDRSPRRAEGTAFDLRGDNIFVVRNCRFINNFVIGSTSSPSMFDGCQSENPEGPANFASIHGRVTSPVLVRRNRAQVGTPQFVEEFSRASDDPEFIDYVCGLKPDGDPESLKLAEALQIRRNLPYWIALIRHERPEVRAQAAARVEALTGRKVFESEEAPLTPAELDKAMSDLANEDIQVRETAMARLTKAGESIRDRIKETSVRESGEAKARAQRVLDCLDHQGRWSAETAFSPQIKWFEENRARLVWDEKLSKYVLK